MTRRILGLIGFELAVAAGGLAVIGRHGSADPRASAWALLGLASLFTLLGLLPPLHVELRRNAYWVTFNEALIPVALFTLGPLAAVAPLVGELVLALVHRQPWLKATFNFVQVGTATVLATLAFTLLGPVDPLSPVGWSVALAALGVYTAFNALSVSAVLALGSKTSVLKTAWQLAPTAVVTFGASASLGIAAVILFERTPLAPVLFLPTLALLVASTRGLEKQRAERSRFERLYGASSRLTRLGTLEETLGVVAEESAGLVTGAAALACNLDDEGDSAGVVVGDARVDPLAAEALASLAALSGMRGTVPVARLAAPLRRMLSPTGYLLVVTTAEQAPARVVLAVLMDMTPDDQDERRLEVLEAFATHAAMVVANVRLYQEVQEALLHEQDLNRQKSDFVATVSHELRTPLAAMLGALQTIRRLGDRLTGDNRERMLELGFTHGQRLQRLIEDLLLVASAEHRDVQCTPKAVDLPAYLHALGDELRTTATGARLVLDAPAALGTVVTDDDKLRHILVNLVDNAAKYAPEGPVEVEAVRSDDRVVIRISDHGPGIPVAERERIFERFVQLDQSATRRQGGTGLGLYLCRQLARVLGGDLVATERSAGGACFELTIPAGTEPPAIEPAAPTAPIPSKSPVMRRPDGIRARPARAAVTTGGTP